MQYRLGDFPDWIAKMLADKYRRFNPALLDLVKGHQLNEDGDCPLESVEPLLPEIFDRIKLAVKDKEKEQDVFDRITAYILELANQQRPEGEDPATIPTIDLESIFTMLEDFLRRNEPELIITDLEKERPKPLSFEENILRTI